MSHPRHFLDMDQLVEKWTILGNKKNPKVAAPKGTSRSGASRKKLTPKEEIARTEDLIENKRKDDDDM
jgi:hypothetical protein